MQYNQNWMQLSLRVYKYVHCKQTLPTSFIHNLFHYEWYVIILELKMIYTLVLLTQIVEKEFFNLKHAMSWMAYQLH